MPLWGNSDAVEAKPKHFTDAEKFNVTREGVVLINRQMLGQGISYNPEF